jgi:hypothetical protein
MLKNRRRQSGKETTKELRKHLSRGQLHVNLLKAEAGRTLSAMSSRGFASKLSFKDALMKYSRCTDGRSACIRRLSRSCTVCRKTIWGKLKFRTSPASLGTEAERADLWRVMIWKQVSFSDATEGWFAKAYRLSIISPEDRIVLQDAGCIVLLLLENQSWRFDCNSCQGCTGRVSHVR